jgi:hypothetical protein
MRGGDAEKRRRITAQRLLVLALRTGHRSMQEPATGHRPLHTSKRTVCSCLISTSYLRNL